MTFVEKLRARQPLVGYWITLDAPPATERIARLGYDYVVLDAQHGLISGGGLLTNLLAVDAGAATGTVGLVRVGANDPAPIGRALDAGAVGVIVPLIETADDVARAVAACKYPPAGVRSFGPSRAGLRIGPVPAEANAQTAVIAMIETRSALDNVTAICATPGLDGIYIGPSDLSLALGAKYPGDPDIAETFEAAVRHIAEVTAEAGIAAGIHTPTGETAHRRLTEGYTFASVASDITHLEQAAASHLSDARA